MCYAIFRSDNLQDFNTYTIKISRVIEEKKIV